MVGTNIGAGQRERALRAAWIGAAIAAALCESDRPLRRGLVPAPGSRSSTPIPAMLDAGARYLHAVGPLYGLFGLGMALYFASQGAGRLLWPLLANFARLAIAAGGGWLVLRASGNLSGVFLALAVALAAFGLINAAAVAGGAWFGRGRRAAPALRWRAEERAAMTERYFEDFAVGQRFAHRHSSASTRSGSRPSPPNSIRSPFHLDEAAARATIFRGLAASGWHTAALTMRLLVAGEFKPAGGIVGAGFDEFRWPRPVRPGDELRVESEVLDVRAVEIAPGSGPRSRCARRPSTRTNEPVQVQTGTLVVQRRAG